VGDEWHAESEGSRRDPPVTVVDLVAESEADPLAGGPYLRERGDHLIVGLDHGQLRYAALETPGTKLAPLGSHAPNRGSITVWNASRTGASPMSSRYWSASGFVRSSNS